MSQEQIFFGEFIHICSCTTTGGTEIIKEKKREKKGNVTFKSKNGFLWSLVDEFFYSAWPD